MRPESHGGRRQGGGRTSSLEATPPVVTRLVPSSAPSSSDVPGGQLTITPRRSRHAVAGSRPHGYRARVPPPSTRGPGRPSTCAALPGGLQNGESVPAWELGEVASGPAQPQGSSGRRGLRGVGAAGLRRHAERARRTHSPASAPALPLAFLKPRFLFPGKTNKQTNTRSVSVADIKITHMMAHIYPVQSMHRGRCSLSSKTNQTNGEPCPVVQVQSETGLSSRHGPPPRSPLTPGRPAPRGLALAEPAFYSYSFAFQNHLVFLAPSEGLILQVPGSQLADQQENHRVQ